MRLMIVALLALASTPQEIESKIRRVTIYPDRARVTREA
jgi:hypothetical protein